MFYYNFKLIFTASDNETQSKVLDDLTVDLYCISTILEGLIDTVDDAGIATTAINTTTNITATLVVCTEESE